ncbi:hypothetical protein EH68_01470 [Enterococcus gallinarum]|nr:hypothetical protein [Enterococcus gallinarum]KIL83032.1 hypothetical protein EH68_01470 [Enterococcus gallinarum]
MNVSEERKITAGTISGATFKSLDIEPSIIVDGKSYTASEFNKAVEMLKQPQLNENQQIVLEWLKSTWIDRKKNCWFPFEVINSLYYQFDVAWGKVSYEEFKRIEKDKPYIKAYGELTALEQFEVLELFSKWALEQGEE